MELTDAVIVGVPETLTGSSVRAFRAALQQAVAETGARVVVLRGKETGVFCRGMDFGAVSSGDEAAEAIEEFALCLSVIRMAPKPVLSFVEGEAIGGGLGVAAAADGVLATLDATFTLPELLFGLAPAIVLPYLAERLTPQKLRWISLSSERLDAQSALRLGLIDRVEPADRCHATLRSWIARLARVRSDAVAIWKRTTLALPAPGSAEGARQTIDRMRNPIVRERLRRFIDTGEPPWTAEDR
jgi:enoyl-CoA hydratase/carnithine racemase